MQLKKIKGQMALATCALLQVSSAAVNAAESSWDIDTAVLYYGESDGRVQAFKPAVSVGHDISEDERIDFRVVSDTLTGATPNGAHASSQVQTFTTPSGEGTYTAAAGETPLDDTFRDMRVALGADWTMPLDRMSRIVWGANMSGESDYISLGVSASYARDLNNRNTTLTAGLAFNNDLVNPHGGTAIGFTPMLAEDSQNNKTAGDQTKTITDFIVGITQVMNRKTMVQLNFSMGQVNGYQNDPYKIVSVVDPSTGLPVATNGSSVITSASGSVSTADTTITGYLPYVYEKRPDKRQKNIVFFKTVHHLTEDAINFSYRYYRDDWDIKSHTLDLKYRYELDDSYLQPHVRYYTQSKANFYKHDLKLGVDIDTTGVALIDYASHDSRLAELETITLGLKYGMPMGGDRELSVRGEFMSQSVNDGAIPVGEETPDLSAITLQVNYSFVW